MIVLSLGVLACSTDKLGAEDSSSGASETQSATDTSSVSDESGTDDATETTGVSADTETTGDPTGTETTGDEPCVPGELDCECLPDTPRCGLDGDRALGCTSNEICRSCGFLLTTERPACRGDACPDTCTIDMGWLGLAGPVQQYVLGYTELSLDGVPIQDLWECSAEPGFIWSVPAEQLSLCGSACEQWMAEGEALELTVFFGCPPGG